MTTYNMEYLCHHFVISVYWHFWQKVGCCKFSKCRISGISWNILYLEIWGNISEIFQQLLSELPTLIIVSVFCEVWHPNFPQDAYRKDCSEELVCFWELPASAPSLTPCQRGSCKCTIHCLHVGDHMGVQMCFDHVPDLNKVFLKAHCLMLH